MAHQPVLTTDNLDEGRIKYNANDVELYSLVDDAQTDADAALSALTDKADLVSGLVPTSQLPSYVDDVIEVANFAALPVTGTAGKIYITLDDNLTYRWATTVYVDLGAGGGLALGETSATAYRGDRGKIAYDVSQTKDASGGFPGLTLLKINFKNAANTIVSFFNNVNTVARTYTFQDRDGTIADDTDLATKQSTLVSGTNIKTINSASILGSGNITVSGLPSGASSIYPTQTSYQQAGIETLGNGSLPLEFINIGNPGFVPQGTEARNLVPAGILRIGGNVLLTRNLTWDQANLEWDTFDQAADSYGSGMLEVGGEGINLQVSPSGATFGTTLRMAFTVRGEGARSLTGYTTGPVNQALAPLFAQYRSAAGNASWLPTTAATPLIHLLSNELKGSSGAFDQNEFIRLETNSSTVSVYPAFNFKTSSGTYGSRTTVVTNRTVGTLGSIVYDGTNDLKTAEIQFTTRGTISTGTVGQSIKFATSPTNTAGLLTRFEIMNDGVTKSFTPFRYELTAITTIPDYTTFLTTPVLSSSSIGQLQQVSATTGGLRVFGFSTTSTASTAVPLMLSGVLGATAPTAPAIVFNALKHSGTTTTADLAATEIAVHFRNNATTIHEILANGNMGIIQTTPTALMHLGPVLAARASLRIHAGATTVAPSSPNSGDIWHQGTNNRLMFYKGASSQEIMTAVQVNSVSPTAPNRTIQLTIDGTTYYISAKTTND